MSLEVEFNTTNYHNMLTWYEFAFGQGKNKPTMDDINTLQKINVMARQYIEDEQFIDKMSKE